MTTAVTIAPTPILQFLDNNGRPCVGGSVLTQVGGVNTATYQDSAGTIALPNPIPLNNRGEVSNSAGTSCQLFLANGVTYVFTLFDANGNQLNQATYVGNTNVAIANLAGTGDATQGAGMVGFLYSLGYAAGTIGAWLKNLALAAGSTFIGWAQGGTGAQTRTVSDKLSEQVSIFDFMTTAQRTDWIAATAASNLSAALDMTSAIQAAINYAATRSLVGGEVYMPPGAGKVTAELFTYGSGAVGQVALIGDGPFVARLFPSGDFTVINDVSSYGETGGFSIEWPSTAKASIPTTRIGVEFAGANWQSSYTTKRKITVNYAYRGFVLNDWTGSPLGTAYLIKLYGLTAFRCADWGIWLNSKTGSTTLILEECYARCDDITPVPASKGIFVNNFNDVTWISCAVDSAVDNWVQVQNANNFTSLDLAFEGCTMVTAASVAVNVNSVSAIMLGVKTISCTFNTGAATNARVISLGANTNNLVVAGYTEQANTFTSGTRYKATMNAANSNLIVLDRSIQAADVLDNGFFANAVYEGTRRASVNLAPNYGTWAKGDYVKSGVPTVGNPKGWYCTAAGTSGTWVSEGNL